MSHTKISHKPNKYCSVCKREVYHTVHRASSYFVDWYGTEISPVCVDCYEKKSENNENKHVH